MRLDHLLSREIRVLTLRWGQGVDGSQVDRTIVRSPSSGGKRRHREVSEIDRDLAKTPKSLEHLDPEFLPLFNCYGASRRADDRTSTATSRMPFLGGRLAQLVRALP